MDEHPVVVQKAYEFNVWLIEKVQRFPRNHRFGVGDRLVEAVLASGPSGRGPVVRGVNWLASKGVPSVPEE